MAVLRLHTHYLFLNELYQLHSKVWDRMRNDPAMSDWDETSEERVYCDQLWAEMAWVWDRMSFKQKCWTLGCVGQVTL